MKIKAKVLLGGLLLTLGIMLASCSNSSSSSGGGTTVVTLNAGDVYTYDATNSTGVTGTAGTIPCGVYMNAAKTAGLFIISSTKGQYAYGFTVKSDGKIDQMSMGGFDEGTISVSGNTLTYTGAITVKATYDSTAKTLTVIK